MNHLTDHWLEQIDRRLANIGDILDAANETLPTLRDQFAMAALIGMMADTRVRDTCERYSNSAYAMADAMMIARKNEP